MSYIRCITLIILFKIKVSSANLPQCLLTNITDVQFDDNATDYFFFSKEFYLTFDLIHIGRDLSSHNWGIVGCSCEKNECEMWCCYANVEISSNSCLRKTPATRNLYVLGEQVDIFENTFRWPNHNKEWRFCIDNHPFSEDIDSKIAMTESRFFTMATFFPNRVIIGKCVRIGDFELLRDAFRQQESISISNDIEDVEVELTFWREFIYWTHVIAIPFDIITIIVYVSLPNLRNVHGISLVCLQISFVTSNIVVISAYSTDYKKNNDLCNVISFLSLWSDMANQLWMFTIGFDLWKSFCLRSSLRRKSSTFKTIAAYSLFTWGSSLLVILLLWIYFPQAIPVEDIEDNNNCWRINCCYAKLFYLEDLTRYTYVESVLASSNSILLFFTFRKICRTERDIAKLNGRVSRGFTKGQQNIDNFLKFFRLFAMGQGTWIFGQITHLIQDFEKLPKFLYEWAWRIDVTLENVKGIIIFFLFPLKKKTRNDFWKRINRFCFQCNKTETNIYTVEIELQSIPQSN